MTNPVIPVLLWTFLVLFLLRVLGQLVVVVAQPGWLPPMREWYSGLVPYPMLLPAQVVILLLLTAIAVSVSLGSQPLAGPHRVVGFVLLGLSLLYAAAMVVRYVLRMTRRPEQRWFGGTIPIIFHVVLASFLFVFAISQLA